MKIADLFVNIGVKGFSATKDALGGVTSGLGGIKDMSLEAKATILGALYGIQQLAQHSATAGLNLERFGDITGLSMKSLQQWQYAARQAGSTNEEFQGSLEGVQAAMAKMLMSGQAPSGLAQMTKVLNDAGENFDPSRVRDTFYVMERLQRASQLIRPDLGRSIIESFGVNDGTFSAMRENAFRPEVFSKAPIYSDGEAKQLKKISVAWGNFGQKLEMAMGHLNAKHGLKLIEDITKLTSEVLKLADVLLIVSERLKVFEIIGKVFDGLTESLRLAMGESPEEVFKQDPNKKKWGDGTWWMNLVDKGSGAMADALYAPPALPGGHHAPTNITVKQNLHFNHDGQDHGKNMDSHQKSVKQAYQQMPAKKRAN